MLIDSGSLVTVQNRNVSSYIVIALQTASSAVLAIVQTVQIIWSMKKKDRRPSGSVLNEIRKPSTLRLVRARYRVMLRSVDIRKGVIAADQVVSRTTANVTKPKFCARTCASVAAARIMKTASNGRL